VLADRGHAVDLWVRGDVQALEGRDWPVSMRAFASALAEPLDTLRTHIEQRLDADRHDWLVADGYDFRDHVLCDALRAHGAMLLMLDDLGHRDLRADLILNQNTSDARLYDMDHVQADRMLLGPRYALIDAVYATMPRDRQPSRLRRVFVTFGGVDRYERSRRVLELLANHAEPLEIVVAIGRYYPSLDGLAAVCGTHRVDVLVDLPDLAAQMRWCDAIVTAAGSTVWQACCLGVPILALQTADNQRYVMKTLADADAALCIDVSVAPERDAGISAVAFADAIRALAASEERARLSERAAHLVDGMGAARVADVMEAWPR
jgi:spore coat polysaccharide biosynthesis predicted glycosyltransferase SpsG